MNRKVFLALTALLAVMVMSLCFLVPSGMILPEAEETYANTEFGAAPQEDEDAAEASVRPYRALASAGATDASTGSAVDFDAIDFLPAVDITALPLDLSEGGRTPIAENFTEDGYHDASIVVKMEKVEAFGCTFYVARVKIATASQLRTAVAGTLKNKRTAYVTQLSQSYNAIVAMNGDNYTNASVKNGYVMRQGELYRKSFSKGLDALFIDEEGDFHIALHGQKNQEAMLAQLKADGHTVNNAFIFGPALVVDGELQTIPDDYQWDRNGSTPRAAIGQVGPLNYIMVQVGERNTESTGVSQSDLAQFMYDQGCQQAYNMDGGNSSILAFSGQAYSYKAEERDLKDIIYFASAIE